MSDKLTQEELATNAVTQEHIRLVARGLHDVVKMLLDRADHHDQSKLEPPEVEVFTEFTPKLAATTYGSAEYNEFKRQMEPALIHHYAKNSHHPEQKRAKEEEWKSIFDGSYEISNFGDIRSVDRTITASKGYSIQRKGQKMTPTITPKGYLRVSLMYSGKPHNYMVHRLVAGAFLDNPKNKKEVNHINGDKQDNHVDNLEWVTSSENLIHAYETGLKKANVKYVVYCEELDIVTFGVEKMEIALRERGYEKASASTIWRIITEDKAEATHLDLHFTSVNIEDYTEESDLRFCTLIDLVEMFCDWKASSQRQADGDIYKSIEINKKRFLMSRDLVRIFENTAKVLDS